MCMALYPTSQSITSLATSSKLQATSELTEDIFHTGFWIPKHLSWITTVERTTRGILVWISLPRSQILHSELCLFLYTLPDGSCIGIATSCIASLIIVLAFMHTIDQTCTKTSLPKIISALFVSQEIKSQRI